jgi:hypothetical protein
MDLSGEMQEVELVDFKSDHALLYKTDFDLQLRLYVIASGDGSRTSAEKGGDSRS